MKGFPGGSAVMRETCNAGNLGSIPGLERSSGEGNGYPLQYSGLENSIVHGITKSWTRLSDFHFTLTEAFVSHSGGQGPMQHLKEKERRRK